MRTLRLNGRLIALSQFSGETKIQRFTLADSGRLWLGAGSLREGSGGTWRDSGKAKVDGHQVVRVTLRV
jgi:hypothetical protein